MDVPHRVDGDRNGHGCFIEGVIFSLLQVTMLARDSHHGRPHIITGVAVADAGGDSGGVGKGGGGGDKCADNGDCAALAYCQVGRLPLVAVACVGLGHGNTAVEGIDDGDLTGNNIADNHMGGGDCAAVTKCQRVRDGVPR